MAAITTSISSSSPPLSSSFPAKSNLKNFNSSKFNPTSISNDLPKKPHKFPIKNSPNKQHKTPNPYLFPLENKNPFAIYKEIQTFASKNNLKEALTILDYLEQQGIPINPSTFNALISACIRSKSLQFGKQIHAHIRINGLENNGFLRTKIVQMYVSCGSIDDAKMVFNGDDGVYGWNALLRGNVIVGRQNYKEMLSIYSRMREIGVEMNVYSYSCLIKSFGGAAAFRQGLKVHCMLIKNGFIGSEMLKTSLIDMYFKCGRVRVACKVFDEMLERDIVVWGAMISGFAHNGLPREAIRFVRLMISEGISPNSVVITALLPVVGEAGGLKLGKEVHGYVFKRKNYVDQPFVKSGLIDMYCKCGDMGYGRKVFYNSKDTSIVSWTALMSGYIANGRDDQALRSLVWMQQEGFRPDVVSLATILPVCAKLKALRKGKEIHGYLVRNGFLPNVALLTSLMVLYSKCGVLEISRRLFNTMENRNVISWTAFMNSCVENKRAYEALEVFRLMQLSKYRADSVTISRALDICNELQLLKLGKEVHGQVFKKGIECVPFVLARVLKMYARCGMIEKAKLLFDLYPSESSVVTTAMMEAYGYNNEFREAVDLFYNLLSNDWLLNISTFDVVLAICDEAGFAEEACKIFQLMTQTYKIGPSKEHYSLVAGLLIRSGQTQEAEKYIQWASRLES